MTINRRISGGRRIRHHKLFGSIENPPFGWAGEKRGVVFSLKDYEALVQQQVKDGKMLKFAQRDVGRTHGHQAWQQGQTFDIWTVTLPRGTGIGHPLSSEPQYRFHEHDRIIAGWIHDRYLSRLSPERTVGAWVATKVGYISYGQPHGGGYIPKGRIFMEQPYYTEDPRCVGINPFTDYEYLGEFTRKVDAHNAPYLMVPSEYAIAAFEAIIARFIKLHGAKK